MNLDLRTIRQYGNLELLARQMVEGFITGLHKSPYHGFSVEFAEHRLYNPGESTRHIDWKVFARTDRLYTKRYEEETNLRCMLVLDRSSSMYYPTPGHEKFGFSITAAAAVAFMLQKQRDAVGLCTFSEEIEHLTPVKSTGAHIHQLFLQLQQMAAEAPSQKKTNVAQVIHRVADRIHRRSLVVIFSDMLDQQADNEELFAALNHLKHNQHEVLLFHVFDRKTEAEFAFAERPYEFIDVETNQRVKVQPSQIRAFYQEHIKQRFEEIRLRCGQYKIDFVEADIGQPIDQILQAYLIKRSRMRV